MGLPFRGAVLIRRLGWAAAALACVLSACAAWVGAAVGRPNDVVEVRVQAREHQPAAARGHICLTDSAHGTICAAFAAGERPVDSLLQAIESRGLRPRIAR